MDHLRFVERQPVCAGVVAKQTAIVRHVEHRHEADAPRIALGLAVLDQHRRGAVELLGQFGVALAAENRAGAGVGVDEAEFFRREREAPARVGEMANRE